MVLPNIRGSPSYGRDWIRPQLGDWGGVDADDVHAALDHVIGLGLADPDRLGVLGLQLRRVHGQLARRHDRPVPGGRLRERRHQPGLGLGQLRHAAPSTTGSRCWATRSRPEGIDKLWRQSPLRNVANVRTPLLMLQGEADLRCPPQDNEQFFIALRQLGRTVEYVLYPEESHVYGDAGRPDRRIDRHDPDARLVRPLPARG